MTSTTRLAVTASDYEAVASLMSEYVAGLPFVLDFQDFASEREALASVYGPDTGAALVVEADGEPVGVCAISRFEEGIAELKRMYLKPETRGRGLGRQLAHHALAAARRLGYQKVRLDTVDALDTASALYRTLGFVEIGSYRHNPRPDARFFELDLPAWPVPDPIGAVLVGGRSSRMGMPKAELLLAERTLADHVEHAMGTAGLTAVRIARSDDAPGMAGPLAGLVGAMRTNPGADVLLAATDQPYLRSETIAGLLAHAGDIVVPIDGLPQTTCALYRDACLLDVESYAAHHPEGSLQAIVAGSATARLVNRDVWRGWGEDGRSWLSLDTAEQFAAAEDSWPEPPTASLFP